MMFLASMQPVRYGRTSESFALIPVLKSFYHSLRSFSSPQRRQAAARSSDPCHSWLSSDYIFLVWDYNPLFQKCKYEKGCPKDNCAKKHIENRSIYQDCGKRESIQERSLRPSSPLPNYLKSCLMATKRALEQFIPRLFPYAFCYYYRNACPFITATIRLQLRQPHPYRSFTISLKYLPRWAKFLKWSKEAQAGDRMTTSPSFAAREAARTAVLKSSSRMMTGRPSA